MEREHLVPEVFLSRINKSINDRKKSKSRKYESARKNRGPDKVICRVADFRAAEQGRSLTYIEYAKYQPCYQEQKIDALVFNDHVQYIILLRIRKCLPASNALACDKL